MPVEETLNNGQKTAAEEQQQGPMPSPEQTTDNQDDGSDELPEGVSERTREQFEKLKKANQEMKAQLESQEANKEESQEETPKKSVLESLRPDEPAQATPSAKSFSDLNQQQVDKIAEDFVDSNGYVDLDRLNKALRDANERAAQAAQLAQSAMQQARRFEETEQIRRAYSKYPQLNPEDESFDPRFWQATRNEIIGQMMKGEQEDLIKAAGSVAKFLGKTEQVSKAKKEAVDQYKASQSQKQQAQGSTGNEGARRSRSTNDELMKRARHGDSRSIGEILKNAGY